MLDGVGYTVTFNIRDKGKEQYGYLIEIKENGRTVSHTAIESLRRTYRASTNTIKAQNSFGVNSNNMQNGEKNSQSFADFYGTFVGDEGKRLWFHTQYNTSF